MKTIFLISSVLIVAYVVCSNGRVVESDLVESAKKSQDSVDLEPVAWNQPQTHSRQKRAVCDLLSGVGLIHTVCATTCILRGFVGGFCTSRGICICRNTPEA
ncbi:defensin Lucifensin-like [Uranotaenia lowii]|uniref:defensin Lucifensin-like n=1 Tax=Uranotaenia lowii TaxID=190385 RepID=UPI0024787B2E|nr:defensin Lucifensin-like [Uranotaenia lowii]